MTIITGCKVKLPCTPFNGNLMDDFYYIELFDLYKGLLTETQRNIFYSHYFLDLSLAETGEEFDMKRQSVYDVVKKVKDKLAEYERILGLKGKVERILAIDGLNESLRAEIKGILEE